MVSGTQPERLNAADISSVLDRFGGQDLMSRGSVVVISLAAIRERAGPRWERKRGDVWAYVDRKVAEHLTYQDLSQRVGEADYLLVMNSEGGVAAQAVALKILEEVLMHFLGAAETRDLSVRAVTSLAGGQVVCAALDPAAIRKAAPPPAPVRKPATREVDPEEEKRRNPFIFTTGSGLKLRIDFSVEKVIALKLNALAAIRIEPTVTETVSNRVIPSRAFAKLHDSDLSVIDKATLDYAALYVPGIDGAATPAMIVPVSFRTMSTTKGRAALIDAAEGAPARMKAAVILELVDIDRGTPSSRLIEVAGLLKTLCRAVFARIQGGKDAMAPLTGARLAGVTLDAAELGGVDERKMAALILDFAKQARGLAPALAVQGLPNEVLFAIAETAGLTHASLRTPVVTTSAVVAA
ncbi:MAG: hypothetical protein KA105_02340 [Caulobacter sp.]|nr:hypothetical protein [Caulobacter sp.]